MNDNQDFTSPVPHYWEESLSEELWRHILSWVPPLELVQCVVRVSKSFRNLLSEKQYWELHAKLVVSASNPKSDDTQNGPSQEFISLLTTRQLQKLCLFSATSQCKNNEDYPSFFCHGSRLVEREKALAIHIGRFRTCLATSTDNSTEALENVLPSNLRPKDGSVLQNMLNELPRWERWWSSGQSPTQDSNETLFFVTDCPLAVLSNLMIRPLLDPYVKHTVYSWREIVVRAYRLPPAKVSQTELGSFGVIAAVPTEQDLDDEEEERVGTDLVDSSSKDKALLENLLHGEVPVWQSTPLAYNGPSHLTRNDSQSQVPWQQVSFTSGVVANAVTITLIGKNNRQFQQSGYYACVDQVKLHGIPLVY